MNVNQKQVIIASIFAVTLVIVAYIVKEIVSPRPPTVKCEDGLRPQIDALDYATWAYVVKLEAKLGDKGKLATTLEPTVLQELTSSVQQANQFRNFLIKSYNGCAITKAQYDQHARTFQALDSLSSQIDALAGQNHLDSGGRTKLNRLIQDYGTMVRTLGAEVKP
jgi:hypothetical protein